MATQERHVNIHDPNQFPIKPQAICAIKWNFVRLGQRGSQHEISPPLLSAAASSFKIWVSDLFSLTDFDPFLNSVTPLSARFVL
jgi:hypothetical protein